MSEMAFEQSATGKTIHIELSATLQQQQQQQYIHRTGKLMTELPPALQDTLDQLQHDMTEAKLQYLKDAHATYPHLHEKCSDESWKGVSVVMSKPQELSQ